MNRYHPESNGERKLPDTLPGLFDAVEQWMPKQAPIFFDHVQHALAEAVSEQPRQSKIARSLILATEFFDAYTPLDPVQADQMADFLYRMLGLIPSVQGLGGKSETSRPPNKRLWAVLIDQLEERMDRIQEESGDFMVPLTDDFHDQMMEVVDSDD